jgi:hypothetical protein
MEAELISIFKDSGIVVVLVYVVISLKKGLKMIYQSKIEVYEKRISDLKEEHQAILDILDKTKPTQPSDTKN